MPTWIFPASWSLTAISLAIDTVLLIVVLAFFAREFFPAFSYLRTHPFLKILLLFGLWILVVIVQAATRIALYGGNPPVAENQQQVINALNDGTLGLAFSFFVTVGVPLVEEMFYRHILIGKLSAYAPTWLVASISAALFAYMQLSPVAGLLLIPAAQHRPDAHLREVREERRLLMAVPRAQQHDHGGLDVHHAGSFAERLIDGCGSAPPGFGRGTTTPTCESDRSRVTPRRSLAIPQPATRKLTGDNLVPIMRTLTR